MAVWAKLKQRGRELTEEVMVYMHFHGRWELGMCIVVVVTDYSW